MSVVRLIEYRSPDTVSILKVLLSLAVQGKLRGLAVCYRMPDGVEKSVLTGLYKDHPSSAVGALITQHSDFHR